MTPVSPRRMKTRLSCRVSLTPALSRARERGVSGAPRAFFTLSPKSGIATRATYSARETGIEPGRRNRYRVPPYADHPASGGGWTVTPGDRHDHARCNCCRDTCRSARGYRTSLGGVPTFRQRASFVDPVSGSGACLQFRSFPVQKSFANWSAWGSWLLVRAVATSSCGARLHGPCRAQPPGLEGWHARGSAQASRCFTRRAHRRAPCPTRRSSRPATESLSENGGQRQCG